LKGAVPEDEDENGGLNGTIPEELYQLSSLVYLYLSFNSLTGTISTKIGRLKSLQTVYVIQFYFSISIIL
jgi:hypothetical protein